MTWTVSKMRRPDPGEPIWSRFGIRPVFWLVYQFSGEARFLRRGRKARGLDSRGRR